MSRAQHTTSNQQLDGAGNGLFTIAAAVGGIGLITALILGALMDHGWDRFFRSYLYAFAAVAAVCLGGLFWTMVQHASRAGWSVALRRIAENVAANLQWMWLLFIPVMLSPWLSHQYHWMHPAGDPLLEHKIPWFFGMSPLNEAGEQVGHIPWFWLFRAAFVLFVWAILSRFFYRNSVAQDATGDVNLTHRMQRFAPLGLVLYALTQSIASIDWIESLEAHWFSTMFAVYFFAASCCGFFAVQILVMKWYHRSGRLTTEITTEHYQDAGKLLFAFGVVFWAYIAFSQYMLIWYGNIPEETTWYMVRQLGGWRMVSILLLVGHFVLPFLLLVTKHTKRVTTVLGLIAAGMLIMHAVDMYYLVMPTIPGDAIATAASYEELRDAAAAGLVEVNFHPSLMDLACLLGLFGIVTAMTVKRMARHALIAQGDPRLPESLAFENF